MKYSKSQLHSHLKALSKQKHVIFLQYKTALKNIPSLTYIFSQRSDKGHTNVYTNFLLSLGE